MTRRIGAVAVAGLLCLGLVASGLAGGAPEAWRALAAMLGVLVIPAILVSGWVLPRVRAARGGIELAVAASFFLWLSLLAIWTECFGRMGVSFTHYADITTWCLLALYAGCVVVGAAKRRGTAGEPQRAQGAGWLIGLAACVALVALVPPNLAPGEDALDHIGHIRRILAFNNMRPDGVLAWPADATASLAADPRKGAFHPVLALVAALGDVGPAVVWRWLGAVMLPAGVVAFLSFSSVFVTSAWGRALCAGLFILSYSGSALRFASASACGEALSASWCWVMVALGVQAGRTRAGASVFLALAVLVFGGVLVHFGVVLHAAVLAATIGLLGAWLGIDRTARLRIGGAVSLAAGAGLAVRALGVIGTANVVHRHVQGVLFVADRWFVASPMEILRVQGLVFLGGIVLVVALSLAARSRPDARAVAAMAVIPFALSFVPWVATPLFAHGSYMVFRSLLAVPVYPAIVITLAWYGAAARAGRRAALLIGAPALVLWSLVFLRPIPEAVMADARHRVASTHDAPLVSRELIRNLAALPPGQTILSDPASSYVISAYTPHRVVSMYQQHGNPFDPYALDRLRAIRDVLSPYVLPEVAVAACRRFGVGYVVVNSGHMENSSDFLSVWSPRTYDTALRRLDSMTGAFVRVDSLGGGCIYRFESTAPVGRSWSMQDSPVLVGAPVLAPCAIDAPDDAFRVTGVSVVPERALPGDSVTVTLGYWRDAPSDFGLPMLIHLRFDDENVATGRRYPGEKFVRRAADRRRSAFTRFRADVRPGHGVYEPDIWPTGMDLCESFTVAIPSNAGLGTYRVEVGITRDSLLPNFHAADIFYNRDHYSGTACARLTVSGYVSGGGPVR